MIKPEEGRGPASRRESVAVRLVEMRAMSERNIMEAFLIATLAACPDCTPSEGWLGRCARSAVVQRCGLWNSQFVGSRFVNIKVIP